MQEVCRAIQRVYYPLKLITVVMAAFLCKDAMIGVGPAQDVDDFPFCLRVYFADKVIATLGVHGERIKFAKVPDDDVAGAKCCSDSDVQHGVHGCLPVLKCPDERGAKHNREGWSAVNAGSNLFDQLLAE
jgi:hypothetical protein